MKIVKVGKNKYRRYNTGDFFNEYSVVIGCIVLGIANIVMVSKIVTGLMGGC